jgi:O-antigen ligase
MEPDSRVREPFIERWLPYLAMGIPVAALASTAAFNILLGMTTALLLWTRIPLRLPPIRLPLALFLGLTLLSIAVSDSPAAGWPQIRKFYIFLALPILYTTLRRPIHHRHLLFGMAAVGTASAAWSLVQFYLKYRRAAEAGLPFYEAYVADRITGFMSHWMTFGGEMMTVGLLLAAFVFFAQRSNAFGAAAVACGIVVALALLLGFTRSIWPATAIGMLYLVWHWRRRWLLAAPAVLVLMIVASPPTVRTRILSAFQPDSRLDSNEHRAVLRRVGVRMIADHPVFGLGPEHVKGRLLEYVPEDVAIPLPNTWWYGHLHNIYLQYAAERGLPVLAVLLWLIARTLLDLSRAARRLPRAPDDRRAVLYGSVAVILGILVGGWWEHNLGDSEVLAMFLTMVGWGYAAAESPGVEKQLDVRHTA